MKTYTRIRVLSMLLLNCLFSYGSNTIIHKINMESGLSDNYIKTFFKDSRGVMWIGAINGLNSYDGTQTNIVSKRFKTPLTGAIQSILENKDGSLLIGTVTGAFIYQIRENKITNLNFGFSSIDVRTIFRSSAGLIYFATEKGLFTYDSNQNRVIPESPQKNAMNLVGIFEDKKRQLWLAASNGIYCYMPKQKPVYYSFAGVKSGLNKISCQILIGDNIYLGLNQGLMVFNTQTCSFNPVTGFENSAILSLATDGKKTLYVGTDREGLFGYDLQTHSMLNITHQELNSTKAITIPSLYYDQSGILWIGTFNEGVYYFNTKRKQPFERIELKNGESKIGLRSIYVSPKGTKYLGSPEGLLIVDPSNRVTARYKAHQTKGLRSHIITTIFPFPGRQDLLLIGTYNGGASLYNTRTGKFGDFSKAKTFQEGTIYRFATDNQQNLWIATLNGLYKYNLATGMLQKYDLSSVLGNNDIFYVMVDRTQRVWLGSKIGAYYFSPKENRIIQPEICKAYRYHCPVIQEDKSGNIWFCFTLGGVLQISNQLKKKSWITTAEGLPANTPKSLTEDNKRNMWIGTANGLCRISQSGEIRSYEQKDGIPSLGFSPGAAVTDKSGNLWWGSADGLIHYSMNNETTNRTIPPIILTDLIVNGNRISADTLTGLKKISPLKYKLNIKGKTNNNLEFIVAALDYSQANKYAFFLEGSDKAWSNPSTNNLIAYSQLSAGTYTLKVKATNYDGVWTPNPLEIEFTIAPYFYETTLFFLFIILIVGGSAIYFTRSYFVRLKNKIVRQLEETKKKSSTATASYKVSEVKSDQIKDALLTYMHEQKPYLNLGIKISDIASDIGFPVHEISQVINNQLSQNYSDFINSYRIEEVKNRIESGSFSKFTLTAIAQQCGFTSRSTFLRAFKKATGISPTEYFKNLKIADED